MSKSEVLKPQQRDVRGHSDFFTYGKWLVTETEDFGEIGREWIFRVYRTVPHANRLMLRYPHQHTFSLLDLLEATRSFDATGPRSLRSTA